MKFFKNFLLFLLWIGIFVVALTSFSTSTLAQETQSPDPATNTDVPVVDTPAPDDPQDGVVFTTVPALEDINELTPYVDVTFHGVGDDKYSLCTGSNFCLIGDDNDPHEIPTVTLKGKLKDISAAVTPEATLTVRLCGDGDQKVKICSDGKGNWFHGGKFYAFSIGVTDSGIYYPIKRAAFYAALSYPKVNLSPSNNITTGSTVNLQIQPAEKNGGSTNNNYQIVVTGPGVKKEACGIITSPKNFPIIKPPSQTGKYTITINEQINDQSYSSTIKGDISKAGSGNIINRIADVGKTVFDVYKGEITGLLDVVDGATGSDFTDNCQGGFTYYKVTCTVTLPLDKGGKGGSCTDPENGKDPDGSEYTTYLKGLGQLTKAGLINPLPCADPANTQDPSGCKKINTAVGKIDVTPQGFINSIFRFVLLIASFAGIIIIIYAGYVFMISRGDKEKLQGARDTLTSAIVGLLFIVLSIVILEIIGVDILKIPGFSR